MDPAAIPFFRAQGGQTPLSSGPVTSLPAQPSEPDHHPTAEGKASVPAVMAPPPARDNPFTRSWAGLVGLGFLAFMVLACMATLPWTLDRYDQQDRLARQLPPSWWPARGDVEDPNSEAARLRAVSEARAIEAGYETPSDAQIRAARPLYLMGTDVLGRSLFIRVLAGGGISLTVGIAAALISVFVGTLYGSISGYVGGRTDAVLMRIVDVLYGLPYILLVVLLAVAGDAWVEEWNTKGKARERWIVREAQLYLAETEGLALKQADVQEVLAERPDLKEQFAQPLATAIGLLQRQTLLERVGDHEGLAAVEAELAALPERAVQAAHRLRPRNLSEWQLQVIGLVILLVAISGVSWLTMARVVRGQVLSLKNQPFMEAARAMGVPVTGQFIRHLLPNLLGPVIVYATLTVPQAILQESFLSFLGIGVRPPLPSWGNLAADGLVELNPYQSHWWLLLFPCLLLGLTLLALNFVGEGLREAFDPKRQRR